MIIIYFLIGWSITSIIVNGTIFNQPRNYMIVKFPFLSNLMTCMQCSGFWIGIVLGILANTGVILNPINDYITGLLLNIFAYGLLNSGISVIINSLLTYFNRGD